MKSTVSSPCSRSDPPLSRQDAAVAHLTLSRFMIWCSGQMALFFLVKAALASLHIAHFLALRQRFPFRQAKFVKSFFPKVYKLSTGPGRTNKSAISFFLLSLCPLLSPQTLWQELSSLSYKVAMGPEHSFFPGKNAAHELASPFATPSSFSPLTSRIHSFSFLELEAY